MLEICLVGRRALREWRSQSCGQHTQRSYSDHDTQKCGIASFGRDDTDDGSFGVEFRLHFPQCPAGRGTGGHAVPVVYLCVWLLQRHGVLLRIPQNAVVILARVHFPPDGLPCVTHQEAHSAGIWLPDGVWVARSVSQVEKSLCDHSSDGIREP
jgi:hypothetical protein